MKTSHILLVIVAVIILTGMIATDALLAQQYEKIDWHNPYQNFKQRLLPRAKHWVVDGVAVSEILIERNQGNVEALVDPDQANVLQTREQGDTVFVTFKPKYNGYHSQPRDDADHPLRIQLVLRLPILQTLRIQQARLTLNDLTTDSLRIVLQASRLRTHQVRVSKACSLQMSQNSFVVLGPEDHYASLQTIVQDSSGIQLNNTQLDMFAKQVSPKAEMQLRGQALKWLK